MVQTDLFGHPVADQVSQEGEYVVALCDADREGRISRCEWLMRHVPSYEGILTDEEDALMLHELIDCFILRQYVSCIILADSILERHLHNILLRRGVRKNGGFGQIIKALEKIDTPISPLLPKISHLHKVRVNFSHQKDALHPYRLFRRSVAERTHVALLLERDARDAVTLAYNVMIRLPKEFATLVEALGGER
ncbi:hypothetical protein [Salinarimonas sp.]|uniref:hypothetical protein n=1 Tax=Salinarimonas sp. TaxID=2766526 RepID=UPI0032D92A16